MHRTCTAILGAVTTVAALGLSGCSADPGSAPSPTPIPLSKPPSPTEVGAPLPAAAPLTDLMGRLSDPAVPGTDKVALIQNGTPADATALDRFAKALHDSGYAPMTFDATDMTWAQDQPGNVIANITMKATGPAAPSNDLKFPMEFSPAQDSWQLTRQTADLLLQMGPPPPAPTPTG